MLYSSPVVDTNCYLQWFLYKPVSLPLDNAVHLLDETVDIDYGLLI